jgi:hypothetical protein
LKDKTKSLPLIPLSGTDFTDLHGLAMENRRDRKGKSTPKSVQGHSPLVQRGVYRNLSPAYGFEEKMWYCRKSAVPQFFF